MGDGTGVDDQFAGPWTSNEVSSSGQVFEFRLWALLTEQSRGMLHVFLPLSDRGIDGLVHRRSDDSYIPIQAKCRSSLHDGEVHISVWAESLRDDSALLVSGLITDGGLGPTLLVIPEADFKRLAYKSSNNGTPIYSAEFGMRPRPDSKWLPWLIPVDRLAEKLGVSLAAEEVIRPRRPEWRSDIGFMGEAEVVHLLSGPGDLNLFRPFPDNETAELAVLHLKSRHVVGIQIKTVEVHASRMHATVNIRESSFRPSPKTDFVVLAWDRDELSFYAECLVIPSTEIAALCGPTDSTGHMSFTWHPGSRTRSDLTSYVISVASLAATVAKLTGTPS